MANRDRIVLLCDKMIEYSVYMLAVCIPFSKTLVEIGFTVGLFFWLLKNIIVNKFRIMAYFPQAPINKYILLFIISSIVSTLFSDYLWTSLRAFFSKTLEYVFVYFIVCEAVRSRQKLKRFLVILTLSFILVIANSTWQYFYGWDFIRHQPTTKELVRGSFSAPNSLAAWMIAVSPIVVCYQFLQEKKIFCTTAILSYLFFTAILLSTHSRTAWMGAVFSLILFFPYMIGALKEAGFRINPAVLVFLTIAVILATAYILSYPAHKNIMRIIRFEAASIKIRASLWKQAVQMIKDAPLIGHGINTYTKIIHRYMTFSKGAYYPHNSYLHMIIETGLIGFLAFCAIVVSWYRQLIKAMYKKKDILLVGIGIGVTSFLMHSFFDNDLYSLSLAVLFWMTLGLGVAAGRADAATDAA